MWWTIVIFSCVVGVFNLRFIFTHRYGYLTDIQVHLEASSLPAPHFTYKTCPNSPNYRYVQVLNPSASLKAVVVCNIHARELIASEICLNWLKQIQKQNYFKMYKIRVFVIANANRQTFINNEAGCVRKNQNEVDLNRNFPTDFNHFKYGKSHEAYGGQSPIDQPFTICLNKLLEEEKPDLFIDVHSGMGDNAFYQQGVNNDAQIRILNNIKSKIIPKLKLTTLKKDGQPINGHIFADLKVRLGIRYSLLFQTFSSDSKICFLYFNPVGKQKDLVRSKYINALNSVFAQVGGM